MATVSINLDLKQTVGSTIESYPTSLEVFEKFGIDYCCGGKKSLEEACLERGIEPEKLLSAIDKANAASNSTFQDSIDWTKASLRELIGYIIAKHHTYTLSEIERLGRLSEKVVSVYAEKQPSLYRVRELFLELSEELQPHLMKEENILFPYIRRLEEEAKLPIAFFGSVTNPIQMMDSEHEKAGAILKELKHLTQDYTPPPDVCFTYKRFFDGLKEFEADLHRHINLESNILFPRAIRLEASYRALV